MKDKIYLVFNRNGVKRLSKSPPTLKGTEKVFVINITIADKVFSKPQFSGNLIVKESDLNTVDQLEFELKLLKDWSKENHE